MQEVTYYVFKEEICKDYNINPKILRTLNLPADRKEIKGFCNSRAAQVTIIDKVGNRIPYMLTLTQRNQEALENGIKLEVIADKYLTEIIKETGVELKSKNVNISEGNGWYSKGTRYEYKDLACEL